MKSSLLTFSLLAVGLTSTAHAEEEQIMHCRLNEVTPQFIIVARDTQTDVWTVSEYTTKLISEHSYHASRIGISVKGKTKRQMGVDLHFPISDGTKIISAQRDGDTVASQVKVVKNGIQTHYRECNVFAVNFFFDAKGLLSENLTTVD